MASNELIKFKQRTNLSTKFGSLFQQLISRSLKIECRATKMLTQLKGMTPGVRCSIWRTH